MTANSDSKRRFMRLSSMESLGFFESPTVIWTNTPPGSFPIGPGPGSTQTTELVPIPQGKHTRRVEPTGEMVRDIWDSTELHTPSLVDWAPQDFSSKTLGRRDFRWPVLLFGLVAILLVVGFGYWLYQRPASTAASAAVELQAEASALSDALQRATPLIADLGSDRLPAANQDSTAFFEMGDAARAMFTASGSLPDVAVAERSAAADAAGLALDASRQLMEATAYRTALEPELTLPLLETDPSLTDLTTATAAFSEWRSEFEALYGALPTGVSSTVSEALDELITGLDTIQTSYIDALGTNDRNGAVGALGGLRAELQSIHHALLADMSEISVSMTDIVEQSREKLAQLLG